MDFAKELEGRTFRFSRVDGTQMGVVTLGPAGTVLGCQSLFEHSWAIDEGRLVFRGIQGRVTTIFDTATRDGVLYRLRGAFIPRGPAPWHVLTEVPDPRPRGIVAELKSELYGDEGPLDFAMAVYLDNGYPHTNLIPEVVRSVLDVVQPRFWLELGSMLGGSAIRVADAVKAQSANTEIVCIDPFTGDANMWDWEQGKRRAQEWRFLRLERGRPTIYDRFLANVSAARHADIILPIMATSIVGLKLLGRLADTGRLSTRPSVIYLDSAHEPDETFLELQNSWALLEPGGVLMGDDWAWAAVRHDVLKFARTIHVNVAVRQHLADRHARFTEEDGVLLDRGQWVLVK